MKNQIILWLSSLAILFLIGYVKSVTNADYPITGTFGIEGKKVSYKLDKVCYEKEFYKNIIISDVDEIQASLFWRINNQQYETVYKTIDRGLECKIPIQKPGHEIKYKLVIKHEEKTFEIFENEFTSLMFWGHIPSPVKILFSLLLFGGLLMAIRSMLELFNNNQNLKKYLFIGCSLFILLNILVNPLYTSYKLGAINKFVPSIGELVDPLLISILLLWITGTTLIFNKIYSRIITIIISFGTIVLFFFI